MIKRLWKHLCNLDQTIKMGFTHDIIDPVERQRSTFYVNWLDHGIIRIFWTNQAEVADGVWRSNHPSHKRLSKLAGDGFRTVVNLRGGLTSAHHRFEEESCAVLGMTLVDVTMSAGVAPTVETLMKLIHVLGNVQKPFLMHCKSGADRTGLASAIYLIVYCNASINEARKHLSIRFLHFRKSKTGILDHVLDLYEARLALGNISFENWIAREYNPSFASTDFSIKNSKLS